MNNIEILEEFIEDYKKLVTQEKEVIIDYKYLKEKVQAIENLIQENKELKEKVNVLNQEKEYLNTIIDSDNDNYIPKSKVKEKIEVIQKRMKEETRTDFLITLKILENELQELLEEGE